MAFEAPSFSFDDLSVYSLDEDPSLHQAFREAFADLDEDAALHLVVGAVDHFWEAREIPNKNDEEPWPEPVASKALLADGILRGLLMRQLSGQILGVEKFNLIVVSPEPGKGSAVYKGAEAMEEAHRISTARLVEYGVRGISARAYRAVTDRRYPDALTQFDIWLGIDSESGEANYWKGLMLAQLGELTEARSWNRKGATLLRSPFLDRVACPTCGWIPLAESTWHCEKCQAAFNTFVTRAKCPRCPHSWIETGCGACHAMSPHKSWWLALPVG